jgi:AraC-like DNA-binding protein
MDTQEQPHVRDRQDNARLWRVEAFGGLELLRAHFVGFTFSPHAHEEFMIVVTEGGTGLPRFWRAEHRINPGDVFVLSPGEVHGGGPAKESMWRYRSFYPPAALMRRVVQELTGDDRGVPHFAEDVVCDPAIATILQQAHAALEEPISILECESRLLEALASLVARHTASKVSAHEVGLEHRSVKRAKEYLETLPNENVSLDTLAREAGIGPFHLCRVFRRETGLSPHAYQIHMRTRLAKSLLMKGIPISQVAAEAGFADQAHLTRHFKRMFGVTPGRYLGGVAPPASVSGSLLIDAPGFFTKHEH